jgi:putative Ca2+/H+ antiporter (TMEM165/GDT1 family)
MASTLATAAVVYGVIFLVELPDKTFVATLVLATRYRPLLVWAGVAAAFFAQTVIAVTLGGVLGEMLPRGAVETVAVVVFALGGVLLLRGASRAGQEEAQQEREFATKGAARASGWRAVTTSFAVLFLAEWGDLSQLLTASMAISYHDRLAVFVGAWAALLTVSGLAAVMGRVLLSRISLATVRRAGGAVCLLVAAVGGLQLLGLLGR